MGAFITLARVFHFSTGLPAVLIRKERAFYALPAPPPKCAGELCQRPALLPVFENTGKPWYITNECEESFICLYLDADTYIRVGPLLREPIDENRVAMLIRNDILPLKKQSRAQRVLRLASGRG